MRPALEMLQSGKPARLARPEDIEARKQFDNMYLLTGKPVLYVCNVDEASAATGNIYSEQVREMAARQGNSSVVISAAIEAEVAQLTDVSEQQEFLSALGLSETGLSRIIKAGYSLLGLETFFTSGPKEAHAWTMRKGCTAPQAAGIIHTDFERGFIRAEVVSYTDYITYKGEVGARENGKLRQEGKAYTMHDGDVVHFLFNV
jgi:ribosome-binding ATPase YchF (GTP1/OBG family)